MTTVMTTRSAGATVSADVTRRTGSWIELSARRRSCSSRGRGDDAVITMRASTPQTAGRAAVRWSGDPRARGFAARARCGPAPAQVGLSSADRRAILPAGPAGGRATRGVRPVDRRCDGRGEAAVRPPIAHAREATVEIVESGLPFDPFNPPLAAVKAAAGLLAQELMYRGAKPSVHNQPAHHAYVVVVPGGYTELMVDVRASFYTWPDPAATYGGLSHALWGDHVDAANRILIAAKGPR